MGIEMVVVDCDAGVDDAVALIMLIAAHKARKFEIKGITCVAGNTTVDNVISNVFKTLDVCYCSDIPVFKGASSSLLNKENSKKAREEQYHGSDGLGDTFTDKVDTSRLEKEHAVLALNRIVSENPEKVAIVCLGPLTNIALAIKMFPDFIHSIYNIWVMGGNITAKGNITSQAEFNFYADPESVHILLDIIKKPLILLPWETCLTSKVPHGWRSKFLGRLNNRIVKFMNAIESGMSKKRKGDYYAPCDAILAGFVVQPDILIASKCYHADIELSGSKTRGQVVLDHLETRETNALIITAWNYEMFQDELFKAVIQ